MDCPYQATPPPEPYREPTPAVESSEEEDSDPEPAGDDPDYADLAFAGLAAVYGGSLEDYLTFPQALEQAFQTCAYKADARSSEPRSFQEAMRRPDADLWYKAATDEIEAHITNGTWEIVQLPPGRRAIRCCWVFKIIKCNADSVTCRT